MLNTSALVAFIATTRPEKARAFYQETLGLTLVSDDSYAFVFDANGTRLRIQRVDVLTPTPYTALGWNVEDIAAEIDRLRERGVEFNRYGWFEQDERGIWTAPGGAQIAWFKDPDGNTLSLAQMP